MAEEKRTDVLLFTAKDLEQANQVRTYLMSSRSHLWLYVMKDEEGSYAVTATSAHGGRLSDNMMTLLGDACRRFATSLDGSLVTEDDIDELGYVGPET